MMRNRTLEQVIFSQPDDDQAYMVYGDWLQEQGHPRGELVAIQQRLHRDPNNSELRAAEAELIHRKREAMLGPLADHLDACAIRWQLGFIRGIWLHGAPSLEKTKAEDVLGALMRSECAAFMSELTLGKFDYETHTRGEAQDLVAALVAQPPPPTLRRLFVFDDRDTVLEVDLGCIGAALPQLEELVVYGPVSLGRLESTSLRTLSLHGDELLRDNIESVCDGQFGNLESLTIWSRTPS